MARRLGRQTRWRALCEESGHRSVVTCIGVDRERATIDVAVDASDRPYVTVARGRFARWRRLLKRQAEATVSPSR
jgi:hypothetical protein